MTILKPNTTKDGAGESPLSEADVEADRISRLNFAAEASHKLEGTELSPPPPPPALQVTAQAETDPWL